jgi:selenide, water dikinase
MQKYKVKGATDITGFGLAGHAMQMAKASGVSFCINTKQLPLLPQVTDLINDGCIPGAAFRNFDYVRESVHFSANVHPVYQTCCTDAQTSGGLFFAIDSQWAQQAINDLHQLGHSDAAIIGDVLPQGGKYVYFE